MQLVVHHRYMYTHTYIYIYMYIHVHVCFQVLFCVHFSTFFGLQHSHLDSLYLLLTLLTTGMHQAVPGSKVIWYDSVTKTGELKYQNALNEHNE